MYTWVSFMQLVLSFASESCPSWARLALNISFAYLSLFVIIWPVGLDPSTGADNTGGSSSSAVSQIGVTPAWALEEPAALPLGSDSGEEESQPELVPVQFCKCQLHVFDSSCWEIGELCIYCWEIGELCIYFPLSSSWLLTSLTSSTYDHFGNIARPLCEWLSSSLIFSKCSTFFLSC